MSSPYEVTRREERVYVDFTPPIDFEAPAPYSGKVRKYRATSMVAVFVAGELESWTVTTNPVKVDNTLAQAAPVEFKARRHSFTRLEEHMRPFGVLAEQLNPRHPSSDSEARHGAQG